MSLRPEDADYSPTQVLVLALAVGMATQARIATGGDRSALAKERRFCLRALSGGAKAPREMSVRALAEVALGVRTSAIGQAIETAEKVLAGRPIGAAVAAPPKKTGGAFALRSAGEGADGWSYFAIPGAGSHVSRMACGSPASLVLVLGEGDSRSEYVIDAGTLVYRPNDRTKPVQDSPAE